MEHDSDTVPVIRLSAIAEKLAHAQHTDEGLHAVIQGTKDLFEAKTAAILLLDERHEHLRIGLSRGLSASFVANFSRPVGTGIVAEIALGGMALLLPDPTIDREASRDVKLEHDFGSAMAVGLSVSGRPIGYLYCDHPYSSKFERTDLQVMRCLGILASLAIERSELYEKVARLAITDSVTGLYTPNHFCERLSSDIARCIRYGEQLGALLFEVEHLSQMENTYGREAAEDALRYVAHLIRENTRGVDYGARLDGDRLIVCLLKTGGEQTAAIGGRIASLTGEASLERQGAADKKGAKPHKVSVFIAGAVAPENGQGAPELLAVLEATLAEAVRKGPGRLLMAAG